MRAQPVRVAIDLETTGLHPEQDAIIEIGALKFAGDETLDTFESFVAPGITLPYRVQRLTGITPSQLQGVPTMAEVAPRLRAFLGDAPLVGHSVPFDAAFLRRVGLARRNPLVDTYELASALLPGLPSYTLAAVGVALGVRSPTYHRALADAQLSRDVFLALIQRLETLDATTIDALAALAAPPDWTPGYFVRSAAREQHGATVSSASLRGLFGGTLGDQFAAKLGVDPGVLSLAVANTKTAPEHAQARLIPTKLPTQTVAIDNDEVPSIEPSSTPETAQIHGIEASVREILVSGGPLLVEIDNDIERLRASLAPALHYAMEQGERTLISVADIDGMRSLARETLPQIFTTLDLKEQTLSIAELGEHDSYLCLHRWFGAARQSRDGVLPRDVTRGLAKLTVWAEETLSGSRTEVTLAGQERDAWERTRSGSEFADSVGACPYRRDGYCFVTRAQKSASEAQIVVTTHAALVADLAGVDHLLPPFTHIVVLDAHLLEDELRRGQSTALNRHELLTQLATLAEIEDNGSPAGLLHLAADRLAARPGAGPSHEQTWFAQVRRANQGVEAFFEALHGVMSDTLGDAQKRFGGESVEQRSLRVDGHTRQSAAWNNAARAWMALDERLAAVAKLAHEVGMSLAPTNGNGKERAIAREGVATDLVASARLLERIRIEGKAIFGASVDENVVQWLRVPYPQNLSNGQGTPPSSFVQDRRQGEAGRVRKQEQGTRQTQTSRELHTADDKAEAPVLHSSPIQVGGLLQPLWAPGHAFIAAAPALAVAGDFTFMRGSLGLPEQTQTLGPAVERYEQSLLCLPTDVPEPNAPQYQRHLDDALVKLAIALKGRLVAIFPSHAALRASAMGIRRTLERNDILVLAQGVDGSARQLWQAFRTEPRVVLLGAGTFWEGAEQSIQPPACVVVTRVPFPALSDPLLAARADMWADPQTQFVTPHAALKLRLALGGLAWSHRQRNAIVLFDRRLQTRGYGSTIIHTLPRCTNYQESMPHITERITEWIG